jgi:hypothetical protein
MMRHDFDSLDWGIFTKRNTVPILPAKKVIHNTYVTLILRQPPAGLMKTRSSADCAFGRSAVSTPANRRRYLPQRRAVGGERAGTANQPIENRALN